MRVTPARLLLVTIAAALAVAAPARAQAPACPGVTGPCPYTATSQVGTNGTGVFRFPQALAILQDGAIAVGDQGSHMVQVFNPDGTFRLNIGSPGTRPGELTSVGALAVADDGTLYVADGETNRILHFAPDGRFINQFGSPGVGVGQFHFGGGRGNSAGAGGGLAVGGPYLFVADSGNDRVQRLSLDGSSASEIIAPGQVANPKGLAFSGGRLYVSDDQNHRILVTDFNGQTITTIGKGNGTAPGQLNFPYGVAVDTHGRVFVADDLNHRVVRFSVQPGYAYKARWGSYGTAPGNLAFPRGIAVDPAGHVYVANTGNDRVEVFDNAGNLIGALGQSGRGLLQFNVPQGVAADPSGVVGVTDASNGRLVLLNGDNSLAANWGSPNPGPTILGRAVATVFDGAGNAYVLDQRRARVAVFDRVTGRAVRFFGTQGSGPGQLLDPSALSVSSDGTVWIADTGNDRIVRFSIDGTYQGAIPNTGPVKGIAAALDGTKAYAVGGQPGKVTVYTADGGVLSTFGGNGRKPGKLSLPAQATLDAGGNLWVADRGNHRIVEFDPNGKFLTQFGERGQGPGQFLLPTGLALDCTGTLTVADSDNNRVQRFALAAPQAFPCQALGPVGVPPALQYPTLPAPDGPALTIRPQRLSKLLSTRTLPLRAGCDTACKLHLTVVLAERRAPVKGQKLKPVSVTLAPLDVDLPAGSTKQIRVPISATAVKALRKGLGKRTGLTATLSATATASVGEATQVSQSLNATA